MSLTLGTSEELRKLFDGLVEQVFMVDIGICDTRLTEYLAGLLGDFVHMDRIYRMRDVDDLAISELARIEAEASLGADGDETRRRRLTYKYIGDFTLFWSGVYPENLRPRRQGGLDRLTAYLLQGKRSYDIAGELTGAAELPPAEVLRELSAQFECCVHGLHLVRAGWERLSQEPAHN